MSIWTTDEWRAANAHLPVFKAVVRGLAMHVYELEAKGRASAKRPRYAVEVQNKARFSTDPGPEPEPDPRNPLIFEYAADFAGLDEAAARAAERWDECRDAASKGKGSVK